MKTYKTKLELIQDNHSNAYVVEQPQGLTAWGLFEREPKEIIVDGEKVHDCLIIDMQTANAIHSVVTALNDRNRDRMLSWSWAVIGERTWTLIGKCSKRPSKYDAANT
jgi:hypothetical protein